MRLDGGGTKLGKMGPGSVFYRIEDALRHRCGRDWYFCFPGCSGGRRFVASLAMAVGEAHAWGLPVMGEMVPVGFDSPDHMRTNREYAIAAAGGCRIGCGLGQDPYAPGFEAVTSTCLCRQSSWVVPKKAANAKCWRKIRTGLDVGAKGVAIGRNIFQADNPKAMVAAIAALIHENISIDEAMKILKG